MTKSQIIKGYRERRIGAANDKAKDYFTKGDMEFIDNLITKAFQSGRESGKIDGLTVAIVSLLRYPFNKYLKKAYRDEMANRIKKLKG